jgi:biopolymer transport protein ExbD
MAIFRKKKGSGAQAINTASLPDIVFMLLFFFMVTTTMKEVALKVQLQQPKATELTKLEKKSLVTYVYVGVPQRQYQATFGSEPRLQLNDQFSTVDDIRSYIVQERESMRENERAKMTVSIKADYDTPMGVIKISYSARQVSELPM